MSDLDFIPPLGVGPLDNYRKLASFDWRRLKIAFEKNPDLLRIKYSIWKTLEADPLFSPSPITLSIDEQKRRAALQVDRINNYKFVPDGIEDADYITKTQKLVTLNEAISTLVPNVSVKMGVGIHLISNTILSLGTERHLPFYKALWNKEILASAAITEIAHGSNTKAFRTKATYDPKTQEFVINTPDFQAAKCWVGNLGKTCTFSLLFAQLYTADGTCHGLHAFIVPIRDPKTLLPYSGIIVGDMGEKIGLNGIDNGFIVFQNYRIKRENLLNRTGDVTPEGEYESSFTDPARILGAALENLSAARVGIMQSSSITLSSSIVIAMRYAALRKQFGCEGQKEMPIIEYQLLQWRLFPYMAAASVYRLFIHEFTDVYLETVQMSNSSEKFDELNDAVSEMHAIVSSLKPLLTWTAMHAIQECREACGGHGYLKASNFGEMRNNHDPSVTYEGDNNVLGQQSSNWLLRQWDNFHIRNTKVQSPFNTISFIGNSKNILTKSFTPQTIADVTNREFLMSSYEWLICWLLKVTSEKLKNELASGKSKFEARNNSQVYKASTLTIVYSEYLALFYCARVIDKLSNDLQPIARRLFNLYGLSRLEKHLVYFYQGGYTNTSKFADIVKEAILNLCSELKPDAIAIIDALAPPDFVLNSVLGKSNGLLYQNLQACFLQNPGVLERPSWWKEIVKSKI